VLEPRTGEVLALASLPFFNPNDPATCTQAALRNRAIGDTFEPGSIFKTFLLSAALEEKAVTRDTVFHCENGAMPFQGGTLHDVHPYGALMVNDVIGKSSNIGSTKIAMRLGAASYHRYLKAFGFGEKTGIDLPGEASGLLRPVERWSGRSIASVAIGQEISVTPLQMAAAFAASVNGGTLWRPRAARADQPRGDGAAALRAKAGAPGDLARDQPPGRRDAHPRRRGGYREGRGGAGLHRRRQDRHGAEVRSAAQDLLQPQVPRLVRRRGAGARPAPRRARHGRRPHAIYA
jgi:cell division protein FtsI (penicillin-binding protein 3)